MMTGRGPRAWAVLALVAVLGAGAVSGCSADDDASAGSQVTSASWARQVVTGTTMWTVSKDGWTITAYDMGRGTAERDSFFSDDATGEPLVAEGDPIVFVNVVATNTGDATGFVGIDEPSLWAMPLDSPYTQGVERVTPATDRQMRDHQVWYHSVMSNADDRLPYTVAPGESFAMGYVLPLSLGDEWVFVPSLRVYQTKETTMGSGLVFDRQSFTFG
ncbi:MAG: hypothetical protein FWD18_08695 [Micrococcales bacterium]|nr:hypothetical protein [Micrococcales bacterium]